MDKVLGISGVERVGEGLVERVDLGMVEEGVLMLGGKGVGEGEDGELVGELGKWGERVGGEGVEMMIGEEGGE
ncbi:hypothetical protein, partial [Neisseria sicca]|uniref:hypothetical protein n=1 Tax=Neisseria sicca TaxID=490 RepID=UPI0021BF59C4